MKKFDFTEYEHWIIAALVVMTVGVCIYILSHKGPSVTVPIKCWDCDLGYDPIGMDKVVRTNCKERPCMEGEK